MTIWIMLYAAALYGLRGHRHPHIREVTHALAVCWVAILSIWLANGGETSHINAMFVRTLTAIWLIMWIATPVARRVGFAAIPVVGAYLVEGWQPDRFGGDLITVAVFGQLAILAWKAWGDGLVKIVARRDGGGLRGGDHGGPVSGTRRQGEGMDQ